MENERENEGKRIRRLTHKATQEEEEEENFISTSTTMPVVSHLSSIVVLVVLIISVQYGKLVSPHSLIFSDRSLAGPIDGEKHRHRRQQQQPQQQQQQVDPSARGSSQPLASSVLSRGFYQSAQFKPPSLSGEKPVGWFDTKYPNWLANYQTNVEKSGGIEGKNESPSR